MQGTWNLLDKIVSSSTENSTRRGSFEGQDACPIARKTHRESARPIILYKVTVSLQRMLLRGYVLSSCLSNLGLRGPYWWSLWRRISTRSDSLHLPPSLSLTSVSHTLISDGTSTPIATLCHSQINSLIGGHFPCTLFSVNGGQENGREEKAGNMGVVSQWLLLCHSPNCLFSGPQKLHPPFLSSISSLCIFLLLQFYI